MALNLSAGPEWLGSLPAITSLLWVMSVQRWGWTTSPQSVSAPVSVSKDAPTGGLTLGGWPCF